MQQLLNRFYRWFFLGWFGLVDRLVFRQQHWQALVLDSQKPVLLLGNHISWWDGAWMLLRNAGHWKRRFNVLMLEAELQKRPFLAALGAIGLPKGRQQLQTLAQLQALAKDPANLLLIFPEGSIGAAQAPTLHFQKGLLNRLYLADWQVVFVFSAVEFLNRPRPSRFHYLQPYAGADAATLEAAFQHFKAQCQQQLASDIAARLHQKR